MTSAETESVNNPGRGVRAPCKVLGKAGTAAAMQVQTRVFDSGTHQAQDS